MTLLFGLDVAGSLAGVPDGGQPGDDALRIERATRAAVTAPFDGSAERLTTHLDQRGRAVLEVARTPSAGTLIAARDWGAFAIDAAVRTLRCAPARMAAWRWQRYLVGQVLPFAAVLRGYEVVHASAVAVGGRALAITGPSGAGKSTLAAALLARGAPLVADDVVALDLDAAAPRVHPGPGLLSLRADVASTFAGMGALLGADEYGVRLIVERHPGALPLGALVFLERTQPADELLVRRVEDPEPRRLLASTFNLALRTPERLVRLLDVCHAIARAVPVLEVDVPTGTPADAVAARIEAAL
jgi:HPr serine kinase-like protein